nr:translation initiation factor IF-2-like [Aegilops tauschii subsp. strangulata]
MATTEATSNRLTTRPAPALPARPASPPLPGHARAKATPALSARLASPAPARAPAPASPAPASARPGLARSGHAPATGEGAVECADADVDGPSRRSARARACRGSRTHGRGEEPLPLTTPSAPSRFYCAMLAPTVAAPC